MKHVVLIPAALAAVLSAGCLVPAGDDAPAGDGGPDEAPGGLPEPCNTGDHNRVPRCSSGIAVEPGAFGSGPSVKTMGSLAQINRGFIEASRLVVAVDFNFRASAVLAVDLETGARTV